MGAVTHRLRPGLLLADEAALVWLRKLQKALAAPLLALAPVATDTRQPESVPRNAPMCPVWPP